MTSLSYALSLCHFFVLTFLREYMFESVVDN